MRVVLAGPSPPVGDGSPTARVPGSESPAGGAEAGSRAEGGQTVGQADGEIVRSAMGTTIGRTSAHFGARAKTAHLRSRPGNPPGSRHGDLPRVGGGAAEDAGMDPPSSLRSSLRHLSLAFATWGRLPPSGRVGVEPN